MALSAQAHRHASIAIIPVAQADVLDGLLEIMIKLIGGGVLKVSVIGRTR
jgi:hypothetical protein